MKAILTHERFNNTKNQYQVKFIYENTDEAKCLKTIIKKFKNKGLIEYGIPHTKNESTIDTIQWLTIPKEILPEFIKLFLSVKNSTIIVGNEEFNSANFESIEDIIDQSHINITIKKGNYFHLSDVYYATFKYANDSQREEVSFDFHTNLNGIIASSHNTDNTNYLFPFIVDRNGMVTLQNTGIIGGTNIPEQTLLFFIKRFINEYNAIITIDNIKIKNSINNSDLLQALTSLNKGKVRKRKDV